MRPNETFERVKITAKEYKLLEKAEKNTTSTKVLKRIQAFKLMQHNWKYDKIAKFLNITNDTITDWIILYKIQGVKSLINLKYKGGQPRLNKKQLQELKQKAKEGVFNIGKDLQKYIEEKFNISYNLSHIHLLSKKNFDYPLKKQEKFQENHQA